MPVEENNKILTIAVNQLSSNNLLRPYNLANLNLQETLDFTRLHWRENEGVEITENHSTIVSAYVHTTIE